MSLPPAVRVDRIALGGERWAYLLHRSPVEFAAQVAVRCRSLEPAPARENAKRAFRIAQAQGYLNAKEMMTAIDTLASWEAAEPGHKAAVLIAVIEIGGGLNRDNELRVLARKEYC